MSIPSAIFPPWQLLPISGPVRKELDRRKSNYGISYNKDATVNLKDYKGPRRTWIRCISNAIVNGRSGFRFINDQDGFKNDYQYNKDPNEQRLEGAFDRNQIGLFDRYQIIGKDINNQFHTIIPTINDYDLYHRPVPGITSINISVEKSIYRKAQIIWKCYSVDQLEYIGSFFFRLYSTVALEWGWNNADPDSLLQLEVGQYAELNPPPGKEQQKGKGLRGAYTNPSIIEENINKSNGNYDAMIGHIIKWDYKYESDLSFTCTTEIASNSRIALGLSMIHLTKDSTSDNSNPTSPYEYFQTNFESELLSGITDTKEIVSTIIESVDGGSIAETTVVAPPKYQLESYKDINLHGKVFNFDKYKKEKQKIPPNKDKSEEITFITFGLLCEVLNKMFCQNIGDSKNNDALPSIDIENAIIGAHINMISTNKDIYLIPNKFAPYFNVTSIMDNYSIQDKNLTSGVFLEGPLVKSGGNWGDFDVNSKVYGAKGARQDLHEVLTSFGGNMADNIADDIADNTCFPQITDKNGNDAYYHGNLKDIFLNIKFIKECVSANNNTLQKILESICVKLNESNPWWNLAPTISDGGKMITIVDQNYISIKSAVKIKTKVGVENNSPVLYLFEPYTSNSILKDFNFDARISDAVATQIINSINSKLNSEGGYSSTVIDNDFFTQYASNLKSGSFDLLIEGSKISTVVPIDVILGNPVEQAEKIKKLTDEIDSQTLSISKARENKSFAELEKLLKERQEQAKNLREKQDISLYDAFVRQEEITSETGKKLPKEARKEAIAAAKSELQSLKSLETKFAGLTTNYDVIRLALPKSYSYLNQKATFYLDQPDFPNRRNMPIPNAEVSFTIEGIGGIKTFQIFGIKNLPSYYSDRVIFKIKEIKHTLDFSQGWNTQISAAIIPVTPEQHEILTQS